MAPYTVHVPPAPKPYPGGILRASLPAGRLVYELRRRC
jgi:hypothetical protein